MTVSATHGCIGNPCTICGMELCTNSGCTCGSYWPCPMHTTSQPYYSYPYQYGTYKFTTLPNTSGLSDEDVERIARKIAEILKEDK